MESYFLSECGVVIWNKGWLWKTYYGAVKEWNKEDHLLGILNSSPPCAFPPQFPGF
jgi:hypothetical protein